MVCNINYLNNTTVRLKFALMPWLGVASAKAIAVNYLKLKYIII